MLHTNDVCIADVRLLQVLVRCGMQAAKVVTANAASVGDLVLGVPLLCSSGLRAEAAAVLQEAGLWRYAATLAAQLPPAAAAAALDNWAHHMQQVLCSLRMAGHRLRPLPTSPSPAGLRVLPGGSELGRIAPCGVQAEGSVWRAAGLLASAGELGAAALLLRGAALPDAAAAFAAAVRDAGMGGEPPLDALF